MTLCLVSEDLDRRGRGEGAVGTVITDQLSRAEMFVLVVFNQFLLVRLALKTAVTSQALHLVTGRDPDLTNLFSWNMINMEEAGGQVTMVSLLVYQ